MRRDAAAAWTALAGTACGGYRMARFASSRHALPRVLSGREAVHVTAVVPARDEAATIGRCLAALCATGVAEVVVVDDGSTDATASVVGNWPDPRVRVLTAPEPKPGRLGKPSACAVGAAASSGDWLWFVDADVAVATDSLGRLLAAAEESSADLVSVLGRLECGSPATSWLLPEVGLTLARRLDLDRDIFASGQCLLVRRSAYEAAGGHAAVAREVLEDVALAREVAAYGGRVVAALAPDLYAVRMYDSLGDAWQGLLKNSAHVRPSAARELAWSATAALPIWLLLRRRQVRLAGAAYALQVALSGGARWRSKMPVWPALGAPVAELLLVANWLSSRLRRRRGSTVIWRGREVRP